MITCKLFATLIYGVRDIEDKMKYKITQTGMAMIVISTKKIPSEMEVAPRYNC